MASRSLHRLIRWLAFVAALIVPALLPAVARAGLLPTCDSRELTVMPAEWLPKPPAPEQCSIGEIPVDADLGDARVAAMCDENGASVVAPPRIHPVADARLDAAPGCGSELSAPLCSSGPNDAPVSVAPFALAEHALLGAGALVPPAWYTLAPPFPADPGAPGAGVKHAIEHPPR